MKFILNATVDTLPHNINLKKWGKSPSDRCPLPGCNMRQSTLHILSGCPVSLKQGRLTWRHDNILAYIAQCLDKTRFEVYVDLPEYQNNTRGTIPLETGIISGDRPDICIIDRKQNSFHVWELTSPYETNIENSHQRKERKYAYFLTDVTTFTPSVNCFEVAARGFVSKENHERLRNLHKFCYKTIKLKTFIQNVSSLAVNSSFFLFISRKDHVWCDPPTLSPLFSTAPQ